MATNQSEIQLIEEHQYMIFKNAKIINANMIQYIEPSHQLHPSHQSQNDDTHIYNDIFIHNSVSIDNNTLIVKIGKTQYAETYAIVPIIDMHKFLIDSLMLLSERVLNKTIDAVRQQITYDIQHKYSMDHILQIQPNINNLYTRQFVKDLIINGKLSLGSRYIINRNENDNNFTIHILDKENKNDIENIEEIREYLALNEEGRRDSSNSFMRYFTSYLD
jgi:hypothetical protein